MWNPKCITVDWTDRYCQNRRNPRVDGYKFGFSLPRVSGSGFWTGLELNQPVFAVQTRTAGGLPRPVANTRHHTDIHAHYRTIDCLKRKKYQIYKNKHKFQNIRYSPLQFTHTAITGCWICSFDKILLWNYNNQSILWIYGWICCTTHWQLTRFWQDRNSPSNCTQSDCSGVLWTWTPNLAMVLFQLRLDPEASIWNCW